MSNTFYLGTTAICIGLSFATLTNSRFDGARTAFLLMGAAVSGTALSQCKNTQSRWEQRVNQSWTEIENIKQKLAETEDALQQQREACLTSVADYSARIEQEREALRAEAEGMKSQFQTQIAAEMDKLNKRELEFERVKQETVARLDLYKQQVLQDAQNQTSIEIEQLRISYERAIEDVNRQLGEVQQEAELWKRRYFELHLDGEATDGISPRLSQYEYLLIELAQEAPGEWLYLNTVRNRSLFKRNKVKQSELENSIISLSRRGMVEADTTTRPPRYRVPI